MHAPTGPITGWRHKLVSHHVIPNPRDTTSNTDDIPTVGCGVGHHWRQIVGRQADATADIVHRHSKLLNSVDRCRNCIEIIWNILLVILSAGVVVSGYGPGLEVGFGSASGNRNA